MNAKLFDALATEEMKLTLFANSSDIEYLTLHSLNAGAGQGGVWLNAEDQILGTAGSNISFYST